MKSEMQNNAKNLRQNQTNAEDALWYYLRAKRLCGLKFKRQVPIGHYIVDFMCFDRKVIVELDGSQHLSQKSYDKRRDEWFQAQGYQILRFNNIEFFENKEAVVEKIAEKCTLGSPSP